MPKTLADWLTYLESLHPKTIALGLERVELVKQRLNFQADFPIITVAGTNGKGSVCAMLEAMLHSAGYKVGCYTSPHLLDYNERVRIAKQQVGDAELCASFEAIELARKGDADSDEVTPSPTLMKQLAIRLSTIKPCKSLVIPRWGERSRVKPSIFTWSGFSPSPSGGNWDGLSSVLSGFSPSPSGGGGV